jgi:CubicO group peptidase (beta-lactamase class C family)
VPAVRRTGISLVAAAFLLAACNGDDSGAPSTSAPSAAGVTITTAPLTSPASSTSTSTATPPPPTTPPATTLAPAPGYPAQPPGVPYPTTDWPVGDLPAAVDRAAIDAAVDAAFGAPDAQARVRSVVIVQGGRIVYERYHPLDGPDVVFDSFSVAKSFTSALVGLLVADGTMTLDEHPPRPEWQTPGDPRQAITLRQLLQMSSGLEWTEAYGPGTTFSAMLAGPNAAAVMAAQPLERPPGSAFEYSTGTSALISGIAADALGGCGAEIDALHTRLLDPLGITTEQLQNDQDGCFYGGFGANMTTRDFARFGLLYLRGGQWDGRQLLPTSWIDETRQPAATNPSYGLHWWLAGDDSSFSAEGLFGQRIVVVPGADLVIAANSTSGGDPYTMVSAIRAALGVPEPPAAPGPPTSG